jgi:heme-degrading monooxygenase HmoA
MAFVVIASPPSRELYEQVSAHVRAAGDPSPGLIVHTASEVDGAVRVVDVWESKEAAEAFERDLLMPAFAAAGVKPEQMAEQPERFETFEAVRGSAPVGAGA